MNTLKNFSHKSMLGGSGNSCNNSCSSVIVIKFGGEIVESNQQLNNLAVSVAELCKHQRIVLVHGGGPQATELSTRLKLTPKIVGGRRVTDPDTLEVMKMTLPGIINSNILAIFRKHKLPGASISGITIVKSRKRPPKAVSGSNGEVIDFGLVGDITDVDVSLIEYLLDGGYIPVINPLSSDDHGQILNINADTVAVQIAKKLRATSFVAITQIGGVFQNVENKSSRFSMMTVEEAKRKISDGVIQGGMIPKLEEGFELLKDQLTFFHIVGLDSADSLLREINNPGSVGTAICR